MKRRNTVADVMTSNVTHVQRGTTYKEIAALLADERISAVPVMDNAGRPIGVVSESDLIYKERFGAPSPPGRLRRWLDDQLGGRLRGRRYKAAARTAEQLMSSPAITIGLTATLSEAARSLTQNDITRLIVIDTDGRITGIVTRSDLLRVFLVADRELEQKVREEIMESLPSDAPWAVKVEVDDGVVTLTGEIDRRSQLPIVEGMARSIDGVVDVVNELDYAEDDTVPVRSMTRRPPRREDGAAGR